MRKDGRKFDELREIKITRNFLKLPNGGSVFIEMGDTKVVCSVILEDRTPLFLKNSGKGWLTAEYSMIPCATQVRNQRERNHIGGRTHEIQRLIGRSLRAVVDLSLFPEQTITIDCDVIQADGGTRITSIIGSFIAMVDLFCKLKEIGKIDKPPLLDFLGAISVGKLNGKIISDLTYEEDSIAQVDMNFVMTGDGRFIEIQGTSERQPFTKEELDTMTNLAIKGINKIIEMEKELLNENLLKNTGILK